MSTTFRRPHSIERVEAPKFHRGEVSPSVHTPDTILANIQPGSPGDYTKIAVQFGGRYQTGVIKVFTNAILRVAGDTPGGSPGDRVLWEGNWYIVIQSSPYNVLGSDLDHYKYMAARVIEAAPDQIAP